MRRLASIGGISDSASHQLSRTGPVRFVHPQRLSRYKRQLSDSRRLRESFDDGLPYLLPKEPDAIATTASRDSSSTRAPRLSGAPQGVGVALSAPRKPATLSVWDRVPGGRLPHNHSEGREAAARDRRDHIHLVEQRSLHGLALRTVGRRALHRRPRVVPAAQST